MLTLGVLTMMIMGMGLLIIPELAGRRLQHQDERWFLRALILALNLAAALRLWPALDGINWLASSRYWPISAVGGLASALGFAFAAMFPPC